jgi:hypothetical protein
MSKKEFSFLKHSDSRGGAHKSPMTEELPSPFSLSVSPSYDTLRFPVRTGSVLTSCWRTALQHWERQTWGGAWQGYSSPCTDPYSLAGSQMGRTVASSFSL